MVVRLTGWTALAALMPGAAYDVVSVGVDLPDTEAAEIDVWRAAS